MTLVIFGAYLHRTTNRNKDLLSIIAQTKWTKAYPPIHPGEILLEDYMKPLGLNQYRLAQDIGVRPSSYR